MMPRILQRDAKLAGAIVMAGNVRPLEELIVEQSEHLASLSGSSVPEKLKQDPWSALPNVPPTYRDDLKSYDAAAEIKKTNARLLILQGERDYQVTMKDFALWRAALEGRKNVVFRSFPELNHLFVAGEGKPSPAEYDKPGHVAAEVVEEIARWVAQGL